MYQIQTLQSEYLAALIKYQTPVMLYFKNGCKLMGTLIGMTNEVIFFKHGITEYFYKSNINSITTIAQYTTKA